jgi:hypothetical protein
MSKQELISKIIRHMLEFQEKYKLNKICITNTQILYDILKSDYFNLNPKVKAVYTISKNGVNIGYTGGHLVIDLNNNIIDCSYDMVSNNTTYYNNFKDFKDELYKLHNTYNNDDIIDYKNELKNYLKFSKKADKMNNDEFLYTDKESYHKQLNYLEKKLDLIIFKK